MRAAAVGAAVERDRTMSLTPADLRRHRQRVRRSLRSVGRFALRVGRSSWLVAAVLVFWEVRTRSKPSLFVPPISKIFDAFVDNWLSTDASRLFLSDLFWDNAIPSLTRAAQGYIGAAVIGITLGILLGVWRPAAAFLGPLIRFGMSVPSTVLLPIAVVLFGITDRMNIFLITFGSVWVILVNTLDGVRAIDPTVTLTAKSLHLSRRRAFWSVLLPGASPQIFAGLRIGLGITLILMVVSELFAATEGIGFYIVFNQRTFNFVDMWSAIFLLAVLGIVLNAAFALLEARLLRWHRGVRGQEGSARVV